jgi:hypothetical protein
MVKPYPTFNPAPPPRTPAKSEAEIVRELLDKNRAQMPLLLETFELNADTAKARFTAYKASGFTDEQAMQLLLQDRAT